MNSKFKKKYHFNYPKQNSLALYQHFAQKYTQKALEDPDASVRIDYDDVLLFVRQMRTRGISTVEMQKAIELIMKTNGKNSIRVDTRSISSHLSKAYNDGILDTVPIPGRDDERYRFPEGIELDGTSSKAKRLDRWNLGLKRREERANASIAGANKRLEEIQQENEEFARALSDHVL